MHVSELRAEALWYLQLIFQWFREGELQIYEGEWQREMTDEWVDGQIDRQIPQAGCIWPMPRVVKSSLKFIVVIVLFFSVRCA